MKKLLMQSICLLLFGCSQNNWDKASAKKAFMAQLPKDLATSATPQMIDQLCDCMAEKAVVKYKSISEANTDIVGMKAIGEQCGSEIASGSYKPSMASNTNNETTNGIDLKAVAAEMNKKCPMKIDEISRMDSATAFNEYLITYHYSILTVSNRDVDLKKFQATMETAMNEKYKTDPQFAKYRNNKINIAYDYKDKDGGFLCYFICGSK